MASEEAVHYVGAEVHTEADTNDQDVHGGDVNGEAPPVTWLYYNACPDMWWVSDQCMKPATSATVRSTHIITSSDPRQLPSVIKVVTKMQAGNKKKYLWKYQYLLSPTEGNPDVPNELNPHDGVCLPVDVGQG